LLGTAVRVAPTLPPVASPKLIVVDDFLPDAEARRAEALSARYRTIDWFFFAGKYSVHRPDNVGAVMKRIEELVGAPLLWGNGPIHGHFRCSLASSKRKAGLNVHTDPFTWNAVLCLTRTKDCRGGLSLYRHRSTGLLGRDPASARVSGQEFP